MPHLQRKFVKVSTSLLILLGLTNSAVSLGKANEKVPGTTVEILTPTEGIDFVAFVHGLSDSVKQSWYAIMPEGAKSHKLKGRVLLRFVVMRDGSLADGSPLLVVSSGQKNLDEAALSAVKNAAPFKGFPEEFRGSNVALEFHFLYNVPPEGPKHSPGN